jgi:hypothetical protein
MGRLLVRKGFRWGTPRQQGIPLAMTGEAVRDTGGISEDDSAKREQGRSNSYEMRWTRLPQRAKIQWEHATKKMSTKNPKMLFIPPA